MLTFSASSRSRTKILCKDYTAGSTDFLVFLDTGQGFLQFSVVRRWGKAGWEKSLTKPLTYLTWHLDSVFPTKLKGKKEISSNKSSRTKGMQSKCDGPKFAIPKKHNAL